MSIHFDELQDLLYLPNPEYTPFITRLRQSQSSSTGEEAIRNAMIVRLLLALQQLREKQAGYSDILGLLRQVVHAYKRRIVMPGNFWKEIGGQGQDFGLYTTTLPDSNLIEIRAVPWKPDWLDDTTTIDDLKQRRSDPLILGDGLISAMSEGKFITYQSEAQKVAVQECLFAPPGSTLLVTLPTGAGKSLCIQLPAWQESRGGTIKGKTTLVIVPTVSLALDQEERGQRTFSHAYGQDFKPSSLTGATSEQVRIAIYKGIEQGTLPILYTSPESLMNTSLYHICIEAARKGTLNRFVIDEAHLVETWGAGFRTEFQFLAAYRKQLLEASQKQLRTILLSATISDGCEKLLQNLFSEKETFYSVRADRLRPEIAYWFNHEDDDIKRENHVVEALKHLPRPIILYVTSPDDTKKWRKILIYHGFQRVEAFSGETKSDERLQLIRAWNNNQYDIMIATSAFGVGVDKSDVRTIIHASLPENIDRFYQEVGRAGRDGFSAISLMCLSKEDFEKAKGMNRAARITVDKAILRWEGMFSSKKSVPDHNNAILIDTNATPSNNKEMHKGPSNREWNEHTLLIMQRAKLITITDLRTETTTNVEQEQINTQDMASDDNPTWLQVELREPHIVTYPHNPDFSRHFDSIRQQEVAKIQEDLTAMQEIVSQYATRKAKKCLAYHFARVYTRSSLACGGCPYCRNKQKKPYTNSLEWEKTGQRLPTFLQEISSSLTELMGHRTRINIILEDPCSIETLQDTLPLLVKLVKAGIQQLILPDALIQNDVWTKQLIDEMANYVKKPHVFLNESWLTIGHQGRPVYPLPTLVIYPLYNQQADEFHRAFSSYQTKQLQRIPVIAMVHRSLYLKSENGTFVDRINGLSTSIERLQDRIQDPQELSF